VAAVRLSRSCLERLPELGVEYVVGTRPVEIDGRRFNEGYLWTRGRGIVPLRRKFFMPDEPGGREARWFDPGDAEFPAYRAGALSFGLNICTELWALETWATYAEADVQVILSPRATGAETRARWLAAGVVAAVRSGAYSISSNRVEPSGSCGGAGWVISPEGRVVATTTPEAPFATVGVDLAAADSARAGYPRYVFRAEAPR
jgi:N-carbamoylputrescine amidase